MRKVALALVVAAVSGCVSGHYEWSRLPGSGHGNLVQDEGACKAQAAGAAEPGFLGVNKDYIEDNCMTGKGWKKGRWVAD